MNYAYLDNISFLRQLGVYAPELLTPDQASDLVRRISLNFGIEEMLNEPEPEDDE